MSEITFVPGNKMRDEELDTFLSNLKVSIIRARDAGNSVTLSHKTHTEDVLTDDGSLDEMILLGWEISVRCRASEWQIETTRKSLEGAKS